MRAALPLLAIVLLAQVVNPQIATPPDPAFYLDVESKQTSAYVWHLPAALQTLRVAVFRNGLRQKQCGTATANCDYMLSGLASGLGVDVTFVFPVAADDVLIFDVWR